METLIKKLPRVLQNEIWEYVHGDRTYWKQQFRLTVVNINQNLWREIASFPDAGRHVEARFGDLGIILEFWRQNNFGILIRKYGPPVWLLPNYPFSPWEVVSSEQGMTREEALKLFYEKVEIEAISGGNIQGPSSGSQNL